MPNAKFVGSRRSEVARSKSIVLCVSGNVSVAAVRRSWISAPLILAVPEMFVDEPGKTLSDYMATLKDQGD